MSIGDQRAFPVPETDRQIGVAGLTKREWLIGMIASGMGMSCSVEWAINQADIVIAALDKEKSNK